ncbi:MAG: DUF255 domain-containing protein [Gammaproteobacteria bacterium]|nr:DUF255 domain-containing protein [Gammaproteobacteria bacterium]
MQTNETWILKVLRAKVGILVYAIAALALTACSTPNEDTVALGHVAAQSNTSPPTSQGINFFDGSFEDALVLAAQSEKMVFVDVYTIWCGPCVVMQETVFPLPEVGEFFNARFVNYKLDAENEEQDGPELEARFDIEAYPTYLILDHNGNELHRASSALPSDQFISMVSRMLGESESAFEEMQKRYDSGERSTEFIRQYLLDATVELSLRELNNQDIDSVRAYYEEGEKYKTIASEYFASRPLLDLINETDIQLVMHFCTGDPRGEEIVEFLIDNYDEVLAVSSEAAMSQLILEATLTSAAKTAQAGDEKFTEYIDALDSYPLSKAVDYERNRDPNSRMLPEKLRFSWETPYLLARKDFDGLIEVYEGRFEKWGDATTATHYSSAASKIILSEESVHRKVALEYAERGYELDQDDPFVVATYVSALMGVERKGDAQSIVEEYRTGLTDSNIDQDNLRIFTILIPKELKETSKKPSVVE